MMSANQHQPDNVEEGRHQQDDVSDDCIYTFLSDGSPSQLDEFLDEWRDEIRRKKTVLRLNDDCFYKIFNYLSEYDFCSVAETCRDLQRLSHIYVEGHSKRFDLNHKCFNRNWSNLRFNDAKRFIRIFGQYLTKMSLISNGYGYQEYDDEMPMRLLPLLDRYCTALEELVLDVAPPSDPMAIIKYKRLTSNLHRLTIGFFTSESSPIHLAFWPIDVDSILTHVGSLKHLELNGLHWSVGEGAYVAKRYETLESLSFRNFLSPNIDVLKTFLTENSHLKKVKFSGCFFAPDENYHTYTLTLPTFPNLESFCLRRKDKKSLLSAYDMDVLPLHLSDISGDFSALKKLRIDMSIFQKSNLNSLLARLAAHNTIENIDISNITLFCNELERCLCALATLTVLRFTSVEGFNNGIVKKLACGLPNLTYVRFDSCDVDFTMIENFMEFSHHVNTIFLQTPLNHPLTTATFSSMLDARLRNKHTNETLTLIVKVIYMTIWRGSQYEDGVGELLTKFSHVIKLEISSLKIR